MYVQYNPDGREGTFSSVCLPYPVSLVRGGTPYCFLHIFPHESYFSGYLYNLVGYMLSPDIIMSPQYLFVYPLEV
jgi:hypothetical protein